MVRTLTTKPCRGATAEGVPCTQRATRQLCVSILSINGSQCSDLDQPNAPWVCEKCYRCPMRCAQKDSQPHLKCKSGPIDRCAGRLATFQLNEFAFNFTSTCGDHKHETGERLTGRKRRRHPRGTSPAKVSRAARRRRRCATAARVSATLEPCASMGSVHYDRSWGTGAAAAGASGQSDAAAFVLEQESWLCPPDSLCDTPPSPRVEAGSPYCAALSEGMPSPANHAQEEKRLLALFADLDASVDFKAGVDCEASVDFDGCVAVDADPFASHLDDDHVGGKHIGDVRLLSSPFLDFGVSEPAAYENELKRGMPLLS